jgi:hypothetical protein
MLFEHGAVLYSQLDDSFTTPRQLLLTEDGFVYMGLAGIAVSVLYDDTGGWVRARHGALLASCYELAWLTSPLATSRQAQGAGKWRSRRAAARRCLRALSEF